MTKKAGKGLFTSASILDRTIKMIEEAPLAGKNLDTKVLYLLRSEYLRHLAQYRRVYLLMQQKYGISFDEFVSQRVVREKEYSWDAGRMEMLMQKQVGKRKNINFYVNSGLQFISEADQWMEIMILRSTQEFPL